MPEGDVVPASGCSSISVVTFATVCLRPRLLPRGGTGEIGDSCCCCCDVPVVVVSAGDVAIGASCAGVDAAAAGVGAGSDTAASPGPAAAAAAAVPRETRPADLLFGGIRICGTCALTPAPVSSSARAAPPPPPTAPPRADRARAGRDASIARGHIDLGAATFAAYGCAVSKAVTAGRALWAPEAERGAGDERGCGQRNQREVWSD